MDEHSKAGEVARQESNRCREKLLRALHYRWWAHDSSCEPTVEMRVIVSFGNVASYLADSSPFPRTRRFASNLVCRGTIVSMATQNSLFAIFHTTHPELVEERLSSIAPWLSLKIEDGQWLLIAPIGTTSKEVCERVGIDTGLANGIVVRFDSYYGLTQPSIWDWLSSKQGVVLGNAASV